MIRLADIWPIAAPDTYKLHFARWNGENQPLEVWARDKREWQGWQEWSRGFANEGRTGDQHDAFSIAAWLSLADRDGTLPQFFKPEMSPPEHTVAQVEGWILGVPGLIRSNTAKDDPATCNSTSFRLH